MRNILGISNYDPFGMILSGRSWEGGSKYRYGYQGSLHDEEISSEGNIYSTFFRELDSRLGRWWSIDPMTKAIPWISPYTSMGDNPIIFNDPQGNIFDIGNDDKSNNDITSIVSIDNQKYLKVENNRVTIDFGDLDEEAKANLLKSDMGLALINDLVSSDKYFLYEASEVILFRDEAGNKDSGLSNSISTTIINASEGGKDSAGKHRHRPKKGYDGQVIINPGAEFEELDANGTVVKKTRESVVFHELSENYERTHNNTDYLGDKGAHNLAKERELKWIGKSNMPGEVTKIIPGPQLSKDRMNEIKKIIKEYYRY